MIQVTRYDEGKVTSIQYDAFTAEPRKGLVWLDFMNATDAELDRLARILKLHPVTRQALSRSSNRPRLMDYGRYFTLTIHVPGGHLDEPHSHEIDIVVGANWVITVHERGIKGILRMQDKCKRINDLMSQGADFFLHELLEELLERFFPLMDWFDETIGWLEDHVLERAAEVKTLSRIGQLRRAIAGLRRTMTSQREIIARLTRSEIKIIRPRTQPYFRDLYEELMRASDSIDNARERLILLRELHMNQVSNRMNSIMKVLTVWATIFLPLTFLTGIWGMNFRFMPELIQPWGYWAALGLMAVVAGAMVLFFKLKRWL